VYSTCLFCHSELGTNETLESFPVGRRLAFDSAKGRLWVICRKCERWNLTPLDERWEAVEQCERMFSQTRLRVSSDNIGMSRMRDGLDLVRIGKPLRPEMAAWRYGDQFGRRRRKYMLTTGAVAVAGVGLLAGGWATGLVAGGGFTVFQLVNGVQRALRDRIVRARIGVPGRQRPAILRGQDMRRITISSADGQLTLLVPDHEKPEYPFVAQGTPEPNPWRLRWGTRDYVKFTGDDALRAAAAVLPAVNLNGASREEVSDAVTFLERTDGPLDLFLTATRIPTSRRRVTMNSYSMMIGTIGDSRPPAGTALLDRLPKPVRLALEMAAHEDIERRAMEGELAILERAWKEAEEIAAISDSMFLPSTVDDKLASLKTPGSPPDPATNG